MAWDDHRKKVFLSTHQRRCWVDSRIYPCNSLHACAFWKFYVMVEFIRVPAPRKIVESSLEYKQCIVTCAFQLRCHENQDSIWYIFGDNTVASKITKVFSTYDIDAQRFQLELERNTEGLDCWSSLISWKSTLGQRAKLKIELYWPFN